MSYFANMSALIQHIFMNILAFGVFMSDVIAQLAEIRNNTGNKKTVGLKDDIIIRFSSKDQNLIRAISKHLKFTNSILKNLVLNI